MQSERPPKPQCNHAETESNGNNTSTATHNPVNDTLEIVVDRNPSVPTDIAAERTSTEHDSMETDLQKACDGAPLPKNVTELLMRLPTSQSSRKRNQQLWRLGVLKGTPGALTADQLTLKHPKPGYQFLPIPKKMKKELRKKYETEPNKHPLMVELSDSDFEPDGDSDDEQEQQDALKNLGSEGAALSALAERGDIDAITTFLRERRMRLEEEKQDGQCSEHNDGPHIHPKINSNANPPEQNRESRTATESGIPGPSRNKTCDNPPSQSPGSSDPLSKSRLKAIESHSTASEQEVISPRLSTVNETRRDTRIHPFIAAAKDAGMSIANPVPEPVPVHHELKPEWEKEVSRFVLCKIHGASVNHSLLSGRHTWLSLPLNARSFRSFVSTADKSERADMIALREIAVKESQSSLDLWSQLCQDRAWYTIPDSLKCDRTFCRDLFDVYYLDAMDCFLNDMKDRDPACIPVKDFPIFQHTLLPRWWSTFRYLKEFFVEEYIRRSHGKMITYDAYEATCCDVKKLNRDYPNTPIWYADLALPCLVGVPMPPSFYYYFKEMAEAEYAGTESGRIRLLRFAGRLEHFGLFVAMWWNSCKYGGKSIVLEEETIDKLSQIVGNAVIVEDTETSVIFSKMRAAARRNPSFHSTLELRPCFLPRAKFVKAVKGSGDPDETAVGNEVWEFDAVSRRLKLAMRQGRRQEMRQSSQMHSLLSRGEVDRIPGLLPFVERKRWLLECSVRCQELIRGLFETFMWSENRLLDAKRDKYLYQDCHNRATHEKDDLAKRVQQLEDEVTYFRKSSNDMRRENDYLRNKLNSQSRPLDNDGHSQRYLQEELQRCRVERDDLVSTIERLRTENHDLKENATNTPICNRSTVSREPSGVKPPSSPFVYQPRNGISDIPVPRRKRLRDELVRPQEELSRYNRRRYFEVNLRCNDKESWST